MQKINCSDKKYWENTQLHINIFIKGGLTFNVNKVCAYMILVVRIYVVFFLKVSRIYTVNDRRLYVKWMCLPFRILNGMSI